MQTDIALLQYMHKNAQMGRSTIPMVMELNRDGEFNKVLRSQLREYNEIADQTAKLVRERGYCPKEPSAMNLMMADSMLRVQARKDPSPAHFSEMMIKGSTNGTIKMCRRIRQYRDSADESLMNIAHKLLKTEERNISELKKFL